MIHHRKLGTAVLVRFRAPLRVCRPFVCIKDQHCKSSAEDSEQRSNLLHSILKKKWHLIHERMPKKIISSLEPHYPVRNLEYHYFTSNEEARGIVSLSDKHDKKRDRFPDKQLPGRYLRFCQSM